LDIDSQDGLDHILFLYKKKGLYGTIAKSRDPALHGRRSVFKTIEELVNSYVEGYID